jgi:hypothetical protein
MRGAIPPLPQYSFMAWCSVKKKAQGQLYLYLYLYVLFEGHHGANGCLVKYETGVKSHRSVKYTMSFTLIHRPCSSAVITCIMAFHLTLCWFTIIGFAVRIDLKALLIIVRFSYESQSAIPVHLRTFVCVCVCVRIRRKWVVKNAAIE